MGFISNAWHAITHPTEEIGKVANVVTKTAENIVHNPLPVIETIALSAALGPAGLGVASSLAAPAIAGATVQAMNGGSIKNIAVAAISGYVGSQVANAAPSAINDLVTSSNPLGSLGVDPSFVTNNITIASSALGASAQATTSALLKGQSLSSALQSGVQAAATSGIYSSLGSLAVDTGVSQQINSVVNAAKNQVLPLLNQASPAVSNVLGSLFVDSSPTPTGLGSLPSSVNTPDQAFGLPSSNVDSGVQNISNALSTAPTSQPTPTPSATPSPIDAATTPDTGLSSLPTSVNTPDEAFNKPADEPVSGPTASDATVSAEPSSPIDTGLSTLPSSVNTPEEAFGASAPNVDTGVQSIAGGLPIDTAAAPVNEMPSPIDTGTSGKLTSFTDPEHPEGVTTIEITDGQGNISSIPVDTSGISDNINVAQNGTTISPSPIDSGLPAPNTTTESDTGTSTYYGQPTELGTTTNFQDNTSTTAYQDPGTGEIINTDSGIPVTPTTGTAEPGSTPTSLSKVIGALPSGGTTTPTATPTSTPTGGTGNLNPFWLSGAPQGLEVKGSTAPALTLQGLPGLGSTESSIAGAAPRMPQGMQPQESAITRLQQVNPALANEIENNRLTAEDLNKPDVLSALREYDPQLLQEFAQRGYAVPGYAKDGGSIHHFASGSNVGCVECLSKTDFLQRRAPAGIVYQPSAKNAIALGALHQLSPQMSMYGSFGQLAKGGLPSKYHEAAPEGHNPEFVTGVTGYYAGGRGTGQSDDIPAMLHDGDYVIDADAVAALGDGSSKAGNEALMHFMGQVPHKKELGANPVPAKIADGEVVLPESFVTALGGGDNKHGAKMLDQMRERLRDHKRSAPTSKIPPKAKSPLEYLKGKG